MIRGLDGDRLTVLRYSGLRCFGNTPKLAFGKTSVILNAPSCFPLADPFKGKRYTLTYADAHGGKRQLPAPLFQPVRGCQCKTGARHTERMAERNRTAMRIDVLSIVGKPKLPQTG